MEEEAHSPPAKEAPQDAPALEVPADCILQSWLQSAFLLRFFRSRPRLNPIPVDDRKAPQSRAREAALVKEVVAPLEVSRRPGECRRSAFDRPSANLDFTEDVSMSRKNRRARRNAGRCAEVRIGPSRSMPGRYRKIPARFYSANSIQSL